MPAETYQISSTAPLDGPGRARPLSANDRVVAAIERHHATLADELRLLTARVLDHARTGDYEASRAALVTWFTLELLPHAQAEEEALYSAGADLETTQLLVTGMVAEHRALAALVAALETATDPVSVAAAAAAARALFEVHLAKENDLLLPALDAAGFDLGEALDGMRAILGGEHEPAELDVRTLPHGGRHEIIFGRLESLAPGTSFTIVNDHDPLPLRYQTEAMWPDRFVWTYVETGPEIWRVEISRAD
jgi:uncharacterized protein (DUF2249 family)